MGDGTGLSDKEQDTMFIPMHHPDQALAIFKTRGRELMEAAETDRLLKTARVESLPRNNRLLPKIVDFLVSFGVRVTDRAVARHVNPGPEGAAQVRAPFAS
jgi:hypothetical protein